MKAADLDRSQSGVRLWSFVFLALIVGANLAVYVRYTQTVLEGWDTLAYLYASERIAEGEEPSVCDRHNQVSGPYFTLAGFNVGARQSECLRLNYPPGFPILLAGAQVLAGSKSAALYVPAAMGALGIVVTFALGTLLLDRWAGLIGALVISLLPSYLSASTSPWSDLAATVFATGGICVYLWGQLAGREGRCWSVVASLVGGGLVVYSLFIRYASGVALLPLAWYILATQKRGALWRVGNWVFASTIVLGVVGLLAFNRYYFGGYLTTGYSPRHGWYAWPAFSLRYALGPSPVGGASLMAAFDTFSGNLGWLLVPSVVGLAVMTCHDRLLIGGLILGYTLLYGVYAFAPRGVNARLLLPALPPFALAVGRGLRYGMQRWRRDGKAWLWVLSGVVLLIVALGLPLPSRLQDLADRNTRAASYVEEIERLVEGTELDAVFLAYATNDAIAYYGRRATLFYRRMPPFDPATATYDWGELEGRLADTVSVLLGSDTPVYYVQDSDPPFADSLDILARHFVLEPRETVPPSFRVLAKH